MYILEGNIGAGKSTFLKLIEDRYPFINTIQEPHDNWKKQSYGQSLLADFYSNPKRWAYTIETLAMSCRIRDHLKNKNLKVTTIMERSVYSGHHCFAYNGFLSGFMTNLEWAIYCRWFDFLVGKKHITPQGFIYLQTTPPISYERIKRRSRPEEKAMTLEYLEQMHKRHEEFLLLKKNASSAIKKVPVLVINCDKEFETNKLQTHKMFDALEKFLNQTQGSGIPAITKEQYHESL